MNRLLILVMFCYFFQTVHPQLKVNALIRDDKAIPLPFATVYNSMTQHGVITNEEGRFELVAQPSDVIVIRLLGYHEYQSTAEEIQNTGNVVLKEAIYHLNEVTVTPNAYNINSILKKFRNNIRKNYPKQAVVINGIYKGYSQMDNEYYGFIQCDVDIQIKSIASYSRPTIHTKVHDYKVLRNLSLKSSYLIDPIFHYRYFWLGSFVFLSNNKIIQHSFAGCIPV